MNIIKRTLRNILQWVVRADDDSMKAEEPTVMRATPSGMYTKSVNGLKRDPSLGDYNKGINFTMFNADGGKIIQVQSYDEKTDRHNSSLYVISDDEKLGEELELIISKERLMR